MRQYAIILHAGCVCTRFRAYVAIQVHQLVLATHTFPNDELQYAFSCCHIFIMIYYCLIQTGYPTSDGRTAHFPDESQHTDEAIMAQSICTSVTGIRGWVYAVERLCTSSNKETCTQICESDKLRKQDGQTSKFQWRASAALHVYRNRPSTLPSTVAHPHLGLKVFRYQNIDSPYCGPNFCCCYVPHGQSLI